MHLTRQLSSHQGDWQGHNKAWQSAPASPRLVRRETPEHLSDWSERQMHREQAQRGQEETKRKALEMRPCQAAGLNIIREKKGEPTVNDPVPPLTSSLCTPTSRLVLSSALTEKNMINHRKLQNRHHFCPNPGLKWHVFRHFSLNLEEEVFSVPNCITSGVLGNYTMILIALCASL